MERSNHGSLAKDEAQGPCAHKPKVVAGELASKQQVGSAGADRSKRLGGTKKPLDGGGRDPFIRAENEDDDGYDPYSDRTAGPEPLFERDPWD